VRGSKGILRLSFALLVCTSAGGDPHSPNSIDAGD
jgi:hypothetical protein